MIDRIAYTAMTGAKHTMGQLANTSHNMSNVHTPGFREIVTAFRAVPLEGEQADSRAFVVRLRPLITRWILQSRVMGFSRFVVQTALRSTPVMADSFEMKTAF